MPNLAELQVYVVTQEIITLNGYSAVITIQEESDTSFCAQLKLKEKNTGQEKVLKFRIGIEQHQPSELRSIHKPDEPHFEIDYYQRADRKGVRAYFTLNIRDDSHLLDCVKGTIVILKEFLEQFGERIGNHNFVNELLYVEAVNEELLQFKKELINVLYDSYKNNQIIAKIDGETKLINTKKRLKRHLNEIEMQPIYISLLERINDL